MSSSGSTRSPRWSASPRTASPPTTFRWRSTPGGALGLLRGRVARANPLWQRARGQEVLAIFQGPQGYVTPAWYPAKAEHGRVVPTWNYAVVQAHGELRALDDPGWVRASSSSASPTRHEGGRPKRWHVADAPEEFIERQLQGIVGIEVALRRLEGKWKMSQNRIAQDRAGVVHGLRRGGDAPSLALAEVVARKDPA